MVVLFGNCPVGLADWHTTRAELKSFCVQEYIFFNEEKSARSLFYVFANPRNLLYSENIHNGFSRIFTMTLYICCRWHRYWLQ
jgi:hypothetical protein